MGDFVMSRKSDVRYVAPFDGLFDADGVQVSSGQDDRGRELPDPVPMSPPVGYRPPPSLADMIKRMVQHELLAVAADQEGFDSFEEAEDFDIEDDPVDPRTPYEAVFDPPAAPRGAPGEGIASPPSPNPPPATDSGVTVDESNVKRSESDVQPASNGSAAHPSGSGAHPSQRAASAHQQGNG